MLVNRIILIILIIASGTFASFYGGNVSYAFFYFTLIVPIISVIYTFYVYIRFRLYQDIEQRIIVKGELVPYAFTIGNENQITFRSIKVNFLHDKSKIINSEDIKEYCLLPNSHEVMETKLRCYYRGTYYVGADSVDIMDFLYLFKITYPLQSKLHVTVLPRIVKIEKLGIAPIEKDVKSSPYLLRSENDIMDIETRKYVVGDSMKQIHWKVSARRNELYSRKYISDPKAGTVIIMDLKPVGSDDLTNAIIEDHIIESTLSIANYYRENNTSVTVYYDQEGLQALSIKGKSDFDLFYQTCVSVYFNATISAEQLIYTSRLNSGDNSFFIIITHNLSDSLITNILQLSEEGNDLAVLLMKDTIGPEEEELAKQFRFSGISFKLVSRVDDIEEVLNV